MCGIAGIVGRVQESNREALQRMSDAIAHRGPDGAGVWESARADGCGVMLAHRRLSILDLSTFAAQPMIDPVTKDVLVFNGEIYNFASLRSELEAAGNELQSNGDTATLLRLLSLRGADAVSRLRGMFAFAFWDSSEERLTLARDPLGIKPLYICRNPDPRGEWSVMFASEIRAIVASGLLKEKFINPHAVASVLWNGFTVAPETIVLGVESMLPGELRVLGGDGAEKARQVYWSTSPRRAGEVGSTSLAHELEDSVRLHLASDVPLSVFLSSGVDSSVIANLANKVSDTPVHTFTLAFEEAEISEGDWSRRIANAIGTRHQEVVLTESMFSEQLDAALDSLDQPSFDGLNTYFMSCAVRDSGFKVALVGTGGDELFGGYTSFRDLPAMMSWSKYAAVVPQSLRVAAAQGIARLLQRSKGDFPPQTRWAKLPDMVARGRDLLALYQLAYALFLPDVQESLLQAHVRSSGDLLDGLPTLRRHALEQESAGRSSLSAISVLEQRLFLGERLLRDADATSMAASIEMRLPLVDHVLFEYVDSLSDTDRYHPIRKKAALRSAGLRGLDPALFNRPKTGFELPYNRWLRKALGRRIDATLRDPDAVTAAGLQPATVARVWQAFLDGAPGLYWTRIWTIYVLIRWCQRHGLQVAA